MIHSLIGRNKALAIGSALAIAVSATVSRATDLDLIGAPTFWAAHPELTGTGVTVVVAEGTTYNDPNDPDGTAPYSAQFDYDDYQLDPQYVFTAPDHTAITYKGKIGTTATTTFNGPFIAGSSTVNQYSSHATTVASNLFGTTTGAAPGITAAVNMNANYLYNNIISTNGTLSAPLTPAGAAVPKIINQSFVFTNATSSGITNALQLYDNYVANKGVIIVSAAGNSGLPFAPSTAYNVISVGDSYGSTAVGPTQDGRSKPDISAPGTLTSFATPYVSGVAAILVQAGNANAGGAGTASAATDPRTVKALLMNGATKPVGWTHSATQPLDPHYGAGVVNVNNSYTNLAGGKRAARAVDNSTTPISGLTVGTTGWDFTTLTNSGGNNSVAHYLIHIDSASNFASTLVWQRHAGTVNGQGVPQIKGINHLNLYLYDVATNALVDQSISSVDNVQHIYTTLNPGIYDLQVFKPGTGYVSATETYALAFWGARLDGADTTGIITAGEALSEEIPGVVPEPASLMVLGVGALLLARRGR